MDITEAQGMDVEAALTVALYVVVGAVVAVSLLRWALVRFLPNHVAGPGGWLIDTRHGRGLLDIREPARPTGVRPLRGPGRSLDGGGDGKGC